MIVKEYPFSNKAAVRLLDQGTAMKVSKLVGVIQESKKLTNRATAESIGISETTFYELKYRNKLSNQTLFRIKQWAGRVK